MVEHALDRVGVHAVRPDQMQHDARIEGAAAGAHGQPVERGEAHGAVHGAAVLDRAHAGAAAEMGDHHSAGSDLRRHLGQHARDVLIGQAVEAVAANALVIEPARQGEPVGELGMAAVERGIEAGDLRQVGLDCGDGADAGEIVRLMQRRQRDRALPAWRAHAGSTRTGAAIVDAAMHYPMTDAEQVGVAEVLAQPVADHAEELGMARAAIVGPAPVDQEPTFGVLGNQARRCADALDLALGGQARPVVRADPDRPRT